MTVPTRPEPPTPPAAPGKPSSSPGAARQPLIEHWRLRDRRYTRRREPLSAAELAIIAAYRQAELDQSPAKERADLWNALLAFQAHPPR